VDHTVFVRVKQCLGQFDGQETCNFWIGELAQIVDEGS
jgi:hypothetical protein